MFLSATGMKLVMGFGLLGGIGLGGHATVLAQTASSGEVVIAGELPRTAQGGVDLPRVRELVAARVGAGAREIVFTGFTVSEAESRSLFLSTDRAHNLLRQAGEALPADGREREISFRGRANGLPVDSRVQRVEEGTLRAKVDGVSLAHLAAEQRVQLVGALGSQVGFDRVRVQGPDQAGNGTRTEFRSDKGIALNDSRGSGRNSGRGSDNSGRGSDSSGNRGDLRQDDRRGDRREDRRIDRQIERREDRRTDRVADALQRPDRNVR
jgi:hypothetical protein